MMKILLFIITCTMMGSMTYAQVISIFPYSEDFEGEGSSTSCSGYVMLSPGWENDLTDGGNDWAADANGTGSGSTGPTVNGGADHNPGVAGGKYMYTETSGCSNDERNLLLPYFDFTALTTPVLNFWYHLYGATMGTMSVDVAVGALGPWTPIWGPTTGSVDIWQEANLPLVAYAGLDSVRVRIRGNTGTSFTSDMAVDDFMVFQPAPVDIVAVSIDSIPATGCGLGIEDVWTTIGQVGSVGLIAGDTIYANYSDGITTINDTIVLAAPLGVAGIYNHMFSSPVDFSVLGAYNMTVEVNTSLDPNNGNDTTYASLASVPLVSTFPYIEDFESGDGGWTMTNIANSTWELAVPNNTIINSAASDSMAWVTNATGLYNASENGYVQGPCFDLSTLDSTDVVTLGTWVQSETSWDGANLTSSTDGGATWSLVGNMGDPTNWYNDNTINGNPGGFQEGWTDNTGGWITACHALGSSLAGQSDVLFRVNFGSDGSVQQEGFAFDDFAIGTPTLISAGTDFEACGPFQASYTEVGTEYIWFAEDTATFVVTLIDTTVNGDLIITNTTLTDTTFNLIAVFKDSLGCSSSDTTLVTIYASPYNVLTDVSICFDQFATFSVDTSSSYSYLWNDASTGSSVTYNTEGTVSVTVTNTSNSCAHTASAFLTVSVPVDIPTLEEICAGGSVTVDAGVYDSYIWSTGETTQSITITTFGIFTVQVVDSVIGCTTFDYVEVVDGCVGLDELNAIAMSIYPNPSTGKFNYSIDNLTGTINMTITDLSGKIIDAGEITEANGTFDLTRFEAGVYILRLQAGDAVSIARLVKN